MHEDDLALIDERAGLPALRLALGAQLAVLPEQQQRALQLRIVDELDYVEVAATLGCSEQAARARVSRGLRLLAAGLELAVGEVEGLNV